MHMRFYTIITLLFFANTLFAQEDYKPKNRAAAVMGYVFVPQQVDENDKSSFRLVPVFGLDYERVLTNKWAMGVYNDVELSSYFIDDPNAESGVLQREFVFISTLCAIYSITDYWTVYGGAGYEFEVNKNFVVGRIGSEYEVPIRNEWDVTFGLSWDYKEIYNSIGFQIAFGKRF